MKVAAALGILAVAVAPVGLSGSPAGNIPEFGRVWAKDRALDLLVAPSTHVEKLADGLTWAEGPVWFADSRYLLFSDIRDGSRRPERSASSAAPRTTAMAITGTGREGCSPVSTTRAG